MPAIQSLRPHDVCVLLQLAIKRGLTFRQLAAEVRLSLGEVHNSKNRLETAGLVSRGMPSVNLHGTIEFLSYGVPYAFPGVLGAEVRGVPTAFSAPPLSDEVESAMMVVWPSPKGSVRGLSLDPLCRSAPGAIDSNPLLYQLLVLTDGIRIGRARERRVARNHLTTLLRSVGR